MQTPGVSNGTSFSFEAIGTRWQIDIADELFAPEKDDLLRRIRERIDVFDKDYSRFREDSLVSEMARRAGTYTLPNDAEPLLSLYRELYDRTGGALTPLIGQTMVEAGYDAAYSLVPKELHAPPAWDDVLDYAYPELTLKRPALLDVGAAGKGYLIDIVADIITAGGVRSFDIDAGGDILHRDAAPLPLRVGLEHPGDTEKVIGVATIANQSICGSAGNRRAWDRFHHIIDPRTLASPRAILATWVVAPTTLLADALATALFFVKPETLMGAYDAEYLIVHDDYHVDVSPKFPAELFTS